MKILEIHNRYLSMGGEDLIVDHISKTLSLRHESCQLFRNNKEWKKNRTPRVSGRRQFRSIKIVNLLIISLRLVMSDDISLLCNYYFNPIQAIGS